MSEPRLSASSSSATTRMAHLRRAALSPLQPVLNPLLALIQSQSFGGLLLALAALCALLLSNSAWAPLYQQLANLPLQLRVGDLLNLDKPLLIWVNDLWMAVFFFLVGLEIKRELLEGELSNPRIAAMPAAAALGGMVVPALLYAAFNQHDATMLRGWAIPAATDIAFALGVLILLGKRVPPALKIFLAAIAIIDDLGAILIIALFYTADLNLTMLYYAAACVLVLVLMNWLGVARTAAYIIVGLLLWLFMLKSGVHATLAGVITALCVPLYARHAAEGWTEEDAAQGDAPSYHSPLKSAEHALHPWVAYLILPVFAFLNAGVSLAGMNAQTFTHTIPLGIIFGLVLGKPIGVFGVLFLLGKLFKLPLPTGCTWGHIFGMSLLCGIGFTMSLFIGGLAFGSVAAYEAEVKVGVLIASLIAGTLGALCFFLTPAPSRTELTP